LISDYDEYIFVIDFFQRITYLNPFAVSQMPLGNLTMTIE
jgi:hypothetical protein